MTQVVTLPWDSPVLYAAVAPWWASREVSEENGARPINDHLCTWCVAFLDGEVAGMACSRWSPKHREWRSVYVLPAFRGRGVYASLCAARLAIGVPAQATANDNSAPFLARIGFVEVARRGRFRIMRRDS